MANLRNDNLKIEKEKKEIKLKFDQQENTVKTTEDEKIKQLDEKMKVERDLKDTLEALESIDNDYKLLQETNRQLQNLLIKYDSEIE